MSSALMNYTEFQLSIVLYNHIVLITFAREREHMLLHMQ